MTLLTRWDPFRDLATMQNRLNRFVRESYSPEGPEEALTTTNFAPPVDIYEDEHNITLKMEVPGIDEKDIDVRIENTTLTVALFAIRNRSQRCTRVLPDTAVTFDSFGPPKTRLRFVVVRQMHFGSAEAVEEENRVVD